MYRFIYKLLYVFIHILLYTYVLYIYMCIFIYVYIDTFIFMYVYFHMYIKEVNWIRQNVCRKKWKMEERYMYGGLFILRFDFDVFSKYKNILSNYFFFVWEIIILIFFWFSWKSSSGLVDIVIWKMD